MDHKAVHAVLFLCVSIDLDGHGVDAHRQLIAADRHRSAVVGLFVVPVSYTHLDVYKRQVRDGAYQQHKGGQPEEAGDEGPEAAPRVRCQLAVDVIVAVLEWIREQNLWWRS